jgi:hypothetical protein
MPATAGRPAIRLAVAVVAVLLVAGCADQTTTETAASTPSTSPTTTTTPSLSAEEVAWLDGLTKLKKTIEKKEMQIYTASSGQMTPEVMRLTGKALGGCGGQLARLGAPSDRLRPVHTLATRACQQFSKAQRCFATAARLSNYGGGVLVGSPQERPYNRAVDCAIAAEDKGRTLLEEAQAKGVEIKASLGGG